MLMWGWFDSDVVELKCLSVCVCVSLSLSVYLTLCSHGTFSLSLLLSLFLYLTHWSVPSTGTCTDTPGPRGRAPVPPKGCVSVCHRCEPVPGLDDVDVDTLPTLALMNAVLVGWLAV